jgi:two-component system sensor histidine kinase KdpD
VIAYARSHNLSKLVIGRDPARRLWPWQRSSGQKLALLAPDIDLVEIGRADGVMQNGDANRNSSWPAPIPGAIPRSPPLQATALCVDSARLRCRDSAVDAAGGALRPLEYRGIFYILTVVLIAVRFGRGAAAWRRC